MFLRRIYYDNNGTVTEIELTEGVATAPAKKAGNCLEWTTPDPDVEAGLYPFDKKGKPRGVTVTVNPITLALTYTYTE